MPIYKPFYLGLSAKIFEKFGSAVELGPCVLDRMVYGLLGYNFVTIAWQNGTIIYLLP